MCAVGSLSVRGLVLKAQRCRRLHYLSRRPFSSRPFQIFRHQSKLPAVVSLAARDHKHAQYRNLNRYVWLIHFINTLPDTTPPQQVTCCTAQCPKPLPSKCFDSSTTQLIPFSHITAATPIPPLPTECAPGGCPDKTPNPDAFAKLVTPELEEPGSLGMYCTDDHRCQC